MASNQLAEALAAISQGISGGVGNFYDAQDEQRRRKLQMEELQRQRAAQDRAVKEGQFKELTGMLDRASHINPELARLIAPQVTSLSDALYGTKLSGQGDQYGLGAYNAPKVQQTVGGPGSSQPAGLNYSPIQFKNGGAVPTSTVPDAAGLRGLSALFTTPMAPKVEHFDFGDTLRITNPYTNESTTIEGQFKPAAAKSLQRGAPELRNGQWMAPVFDPASGTTTYQQAGQPTANVNTEANIDQRAKQFDTTIKLRTKEDVQRARGIAEKAARLKNTDKYTGILNQAQYDLDLAESYANIDDAFGQAQALAAQKEAEKKQAAETKRTDAANKKAEATMKRQFGEYWAQVLPNEMAQKMLAYYRDRALGKKVSPPYDGATLRAGMADVEKGKTNNTYQATPAPQPSASPVTAAVKDILSQIGVK